MQSALIAKLSGKKFFVLVVFSIVAQFICIFIGGLVVSIPPTSKNILAIACKNDCVNISKPKFEKWYYTKGKGSCEAVDMFMYDADVQNKVYEVVYAIQISLPKNGDEFDYSRWQRHLTGILHFDMINRKNLKIETQSPIIVDLRLAHRNKEDPPGEWKYFTSSKIKKNLECFTNNEKAHYSYCMPITLFELDTLYHDYYLLNIRFPLMNDGTDVNRILNKMSDLWLNVINQDGNSKKLFILLKSILSPLVIGVTIWYWKQTRILSRSSTTLPYILLILASILSLLNIPLEYLTLRWNMLFIPTVNYITQKIFHIMLLSFLLIFVNEHLKIPDYDQQYNWMHYHWYIVPVIIGCSSLLFEFHILAELLAGCYLLFMIYTIRKIFIKFNIEKRILPILNTSKRLCYEEGVYRYKFLLFVTLLCASLTIFDFIYKLMLKKRQKFDENHGTETVSAFFISIYGMWNIYIMVLLCLYAPSQKKKSSK